MLNSKTRSKRLLTISHQWYPKPVRKYSLGHQNNVETTLNKALFRHYFATLSRYVRSIFRYYD